MNTVIYVDELIFLNTIINYFLILTSAFISRSDFSRLRILAGSFVGGISSMLIFLPQLHIVLSVAIKAALSVLIVICSFRFRGLRGFLRICLSFVVVNLLFAGAMLALCLTLGGEKVSDIKALFPMDKAGEAILKVGKLKMKKIKVEE